MKTNTVISVCVGLLLVSLAIYKIQSYPEYALFDAAKKGDAALVDYLLEHGFDTEKRGREGWPP